MPVLPASGQFAGSAGLSADTDTTSSETDMVQFVDDYNAPDAEPEGTSFDPLPVGQYLAQIIESDVVDNAKNTGRIMKLTWEILDGDYSGRKIFQNINFKHESEKVQQIGRREMDRVVWACGVSTLNDTEDLHWKPCVIKVQIEPAKGDYGPRNRIADVTAPNGPASSAPPASAQQRSFGGPAAPGSRSANAGAATGQSVTGSAQTAGRSTSPAGSGGRPAAGSRPWGSR